MARGHNPNFETDLILFCREVPNHVKTDCYASGSATVGHSDISQCKPFSFDCSLRPLLGIGLYLWRALSFCTSWSPLPQRSRPFSASRPQLGHPPARVISLARRGGSCAPSTPACPYALPLTLSPLAPPPPLSDSLPAALPPGMWTPTTTGNCRHLSTVWLLPVESDHRGGACNKWREPDPATSLDTVPCSGHSHAYISAMGRSCASLCVCITVALCLPPPPPPLPLHGLFHPSHALTVVTRPAGTGAGMAHR